MGELCGAARPVVDRLSYPFRDIEKLAHHVHSDQDLAATIASGSFRTAGMIVAPCSMKTFSGIVHSYADNRLVKRWQGAGGR